MTLPPYDLDAPPPRLALPPRPLARVELPRWGFVKRLGDGRIDFVSPVPCPYNYGCLPGIASGDGDDLDVLLLGPRLAPGVELRLPVQGVLGFVDGGALDPKVVCGAGALGTREAAWLAAFCRTYAAAKHALNRARGRPGATRCLGWLPWDPIDPG